MDVSEALFQNSPKAEEEQPCAELDSEPPASQPRSSTAPPEPWHLQNGASPTTEEDSMPPLVSIPVCSECLGAKKGQKLNLKSVRTQSCNALKMGINYQQLAQDQLSDPDNKPTKQLQPT